MAKLLTLATLLGAAVTIGAMSSSSLRFAYAYGDAEADRPHHNPPSNINFPPQFYVTTGTTIPFIGSDPVAQTGAIYYDEVNQRVRVDNFWLGNQRSFIVDLGKQQGFIVSNDQCTALKLTGGLKRYGVPDGAIRSLDPVAVRGVPVLHYTAVEKEETVQLVDFFVRPMNLTFVYDQGYDSGEMEHDEIAPEAAEANEAKIKDDVGGFFVPWQIKSKRLRQRTIAPPSAATDLPNWRFFGEPMDEVITAEDAEEEFAGRAPPGPDGKPVPRGAVEKLVEDVTVTVDFFNFVPAEPAPSIFAPPSNCLDQDPKHEFNYNVNVHQAQRLLVDMSFNSRQGRRLMDHLWKAEFIKRVGAGGTMAAAAAAAKKQLPAAAAANKNAEL